MFQPLQANQNIAMYLQAGWFRIIVRTHPELGMPSCPEKRVTYRASELFTRMGALSLIIELVLKA